MSSDNLYTAIDSTGTYECSVLSPELTKDMVTSLEYTFKTTEGAEFPITINELDYENE